MTGTCSDGENEIKAEDCYVDDKNCFKIKRLTNNNGWVQTWIPYLVAVVVLVGLPIIAIAAFKIIHK